MSWYAKPIGGYPLGSNEAKENALGIYFLLASQINPFKFSTVAVAAILGNMQHESGLNPWRWESDNVPSIAQYQSWSADEQQRHGYGLFQYTPALKYIGNPPRATAHFSN